jgi:hypothetical protein
MRTWPLFSKIYDSVIWVVYNINPWNTEQKKSSCFYCIWYIWYTIFLIIFNTFHNNFVPWTQLKTESYFYSGFSFPLQLNGMKYLKYKRTGMYGLEEKSERNLYYNGSWQLPRFIWAVLTDWLLLAHSEHWQHSQSVLLSLADGQTKHLPCRLSPFFFEVIGEAVCFSWDIPCCHGSAIMSVDVSTISPSSYKWSYNLFTQRRLIRTPYDSSVVAN